MGKLSGSQNCLLSSHMPFTLRPPGLSAPLRNHAQGTWGSVPARPGRLALLGPCISCVSGPVMSHFLGGLSCNLAEQLPALVGLSRLLCPAFCSPPALDTAHWALLRHQPHPSLGHSVKKEARFYADHKYHALWFSMCLLAEGVQRM